METVLKYPEHIYDPLRRQIAETFIKHELRKLSPSLRDHQSWTVVDGDVENWFEGFPTLAPVRDFWNSVHAFSRGIRLKNIVSRLTSQNINWEIKEINVDQLQLGVTWNDGLSQLGWRPGVPTVRQYLFDSYHAKDLETLKDVLAKKSGETMQRDYDPIMVVGKQNNYIVVDGNRRTLQAVVKGDRAILAAVGEIVQEPELFESWVPTSLLLDLVSFNRYSAANGKIITENIAKVIAELILPSTSGQLEFKNRCLRQDDQSDKGLLLAVENIFKQNNKQLL